MFLQHVRGQKVLLHCWVFFDCFLWGAAAASSSFFHMCLICLCFDQLVFVWSEGGPAESKGFGASTSKPAASTSQPADQTPRKQQVSRWQIASHDPAEWTAWLKEQKKGPNVTGDNVYVQVRIVLWRFTA